MKRKMRYENAICYYLINRTLSKSSLRANSTRNIIMLLFFKCIHSSIRQQQILAFSRILLNNHFSPQQAPSVPFLYKYLKRREYVLQSFQKFLLSLSIARYTKNLFFFICMSCFFPVRPVIFISCHLCLWHVVEY